MGLAAISKPKRREIVHMKTQVSTWPGCTAPLCCPSAWQKVASYNWNRVTCKRCLAKRKQGRKKKGESDGLGT